MLLSLLFVAVKDSQMNGEVGFVVDEAQVPAVIAPDIMQNIDTASVSVCTAVELDSTKGMQCLVDSHFVFLLEYQCNPMFLLCLNQLL
jgi:hypothetical protein